MSYPSPRPGKEDPESIGNLFEVTAVRGEAGACGPQAIGCHIADFGPWVWSDRKVELVRLREGNELAWVQLGGHVY